MECPPEAMAFPLSCHLSFITTQYVWWLFLENVSTGYVVAIMTVMSSFVRMFCALPHPSARRLSYLCIISPTPRPSIETVPHSE